MGGRAKCLLEVQGQSLLDRLVRSVRTLGLRNPVLVLGHHAAEIQAHLAQWPEHFEPRQVVNPAPEDDPASSLHLGLRTLDGDVHAVMVLLADQPLINAADIGAVLDAFQRRPPGAQVLLPMVHGVPGHPVVFDAAVRADLLAGCDLFWIGACRLVCLAPPCSRTGHVPWPHITNPNQCARVNKRPCRPRWCRAHCVAKQTKPGRRGYRRNSVGPLPNQSCCSKPH